MTHARPLTDPRSPPPDFDEIVEWFERISGQLVLLEEYPFDDVRFALGEFDRAVRDHLRAYEVRVTSFSAAASNLSEVRAILRSDHARFAISLEQLGWFFRIVEGEDHGGHRQALGQYGRVLTEALRRHRTEERGYLAVAADASRRTPPGARPGNPKEPPSGRP